MVVIVVVVDVEIVVIAVEKISSMNLLILLVGWLIDAIMGIVFKTITCRHEIKKLGVSPPPREK